MKKGVEDFDDAKDTVVDVAEVKERGKSTSDADDGLDFTREVSLTSLEWRLYYDKLAAFKRQYGESALQSGDIPPIEIGDKILVSYGTFENPRVVGIITRKRSYVFEEDDDNK